jgi:hypothetical protein
MPGLANIYHTATGQVLSDFVPKDEAIKGFSPAEHASSVQEKIDWLSHPSTKKTFESINKEIDSLIEQAINLACTYPQHKNEHNIIQLLVRANEQRKVIETYASHKTATS